MTIRHSQHPSARLLLVITALIAGASTVLVATHDQKQQPTALPASTSSHRQPEAWPHIPACPRSTSSVDRILPIGQRELRAAIQHAARFAAAYTTRTSAATYLRRLKPLVTPGLYRTIARGASAAGVSLHTYGRLRATRTRVIGPTSVIVVATATLLSTASPTGDRTRRQTLHLAITVTAIRRSEPSSREQAWTVTSAQPAGEGDSGGTADADEP